jgi:osmotically-inducible protein OsmY
MPAVKSMKTEDQQLRESMMRELEWEPQITSKEISVAVHNHVVTLSGLTQSYTEKLAAERVAKRVYGVKDVVNNLEVKPGIVKPDHELAREVAQALERNFIVPDTRIEITVKDGEIVLEGNVAWHYQSDAAESAVRDLAGVKSVLNRIVVSSTVPAPDVRNKIEEALRRRADVDPRHVAVLSHNGTVELCGTVHSWTEKEEVASVAWAAPGVTQVKNNLAVTP